MYLRVYFKSGRVLLQNWHLLQNGSMLYYKTGSLVYYKTGRFLLQIWHLLQIGSVFITKLAPITKRVDFLLQNWHLLQNGSIITKRVVTQATIRL